MGKWLAGIASALLIGTIMWFLSNRFFPSWFPDAQPPAVPKPLTAECSATPPIVAPGATTDITVKVTYDGIPLEGARVKVSVGGGTFLGGGREIADQTWSGGVFRTSWTAPSPSASGYNIPAQVSIDGMRTRDGELSGSTRTDCMIVVR